MSPTTARTLAPAAALLAAAFTLGACGGSGSGSSSQDEAAARTTVQRAVQAEAHGDGKTFCSLLASDALKAEDQNANLYSRNGRTVTCADVHSFAIPGQQATSAKLRKIRTDAIKTMKVESVDVKGDKATVKITYQLPASTPGGDGKRTPGVFHLVKQGGRWLITYT